MRCWETIPGDHSPGVQQLNSLDFEGDVLGFDLKEKPEILADVVAEQGALLIADLVRISRDVKDTIAIHVLQESGTTAGERLGVASRRRNRDGHDRQQYCGHPQRDSLHGLVSFFRTAVRETRMSATIVYDSIPRIAVFQQRLGKW